jgi:hypothetical protein
MPVHRALLGIALAAVALGGAIALYAVDPAADWLPKCPLFQMTGWHCPGCGATRAAHALLHGEFGRALSMNPLLVCVAPPAAAYWMWNRHRHGAAWSTSIPARAVLVVLIVMVGYGVLRNLPWYPFTLLAPH